MKCTNCHIAPVPYRAYPSAPVPLSLARVASGLGSESSPRGPEHLVEEFPLLLAT